MNNKYSVFVQSTAKTVEQTLFYENAVLKEICDIKMTSPNEQKEIEGTSKSNIQEASDKHNRYDDKIITALKNEKSPDSVYNTKKYFLNLKFDQTEDQNSIEYKRAILTQKLMTDVTFSLNKAFEFSFQDKMKNNIISTLSKNPKDQLNTDIKLQTDVIDNNFILSLCSNNFSIGDIWGEKNEELNKRERRETFLGFKNSNEEIENAIMEDEIIHAKRNYFPEHSFHITFNYEEDEDFDEETYNFFVNFVERNKDTKIASKVKLVLSYIDEINTETGKPLFSNKVKNQKLHYWKKEYDEAFDKYRQIIKQKEIKQQEESKNRKNSFLNSKLYSPYIKQIKTKNNITPKISSNDLESMSGNSNSERNSTNTKKGLRHSIK